MVFCGQCGYQLGLGDTICPRCGTKSEVEPGEYDPGTYNPTEISHAVLDVPTRAVPPAPQPEPLVLGSQAPNEQLANQTTTMMNSQNYPPQTYTGYQQQQPGMYGYPNPGVYQQYQANQAAQAAALAQVLEASRKGKVTSLLLILFGILLLIIAIIIFLLTRDGIIFA